MAKILWIDDKAGKGTKARIGFDALIYFIETRGHQVDIASTNEQIEAELRDINSYDILILDIIMNPLSFSSKHGHQYGGIDAIEKLTSLHVQIPIIILSVMSPRMIRNEIAHRGLDLSHTNIKEIKRKGPLTPTELADIVELNLAEGEKGMDRGIS